MCEGSRTEDAGCVPRQSADTPTPPRRPQTELVFGTSLLLFELEHCWKIAGHLKGSVTLCERAASHTSGWQRIGEAELLLWAWKMKLWICDAHYPLGDVGAAEAAGISGTFKQKSFAIRRLMGHMSKQNQSFMASFSFKLLRIGEFFSKNVTKNMFYKN